MNIKKNLKSMAGILTITALLLGIYVIDVSASPPTNDNIADATVINYFPYSDSSSTTEATIEDNDPETCGGKFNSIWYKYTPANNATLYISTSTAWQYFITISIYQMVDGVLTPIACQNEQGGITNLNLDVIADETYYFELMSRFASEIYPPPEPAPPADGGNVSIEIHTSPANDSFANATSILETPYSDTVDTTYATTEPGEPANCGWNFQKTTWYSFTPTTSGMYVAESPTGYYPTLAVYTGSDLSNLQLINCGSAYFTRIILTLDAGTTYYLQAYSNSDLGGMMTVNITQILPPANDDFVDAEIITETPYSDFVDITNATTEPGEPSPGCGWNFGRTIWYSFTPTTSGAYTAEAFDGYPVLGVYTGSDLYHLQALACAQINAQITMKLEAGITYYYQAFDLNTGDIMNKGFNFYSTPPPDAYIGFWPIDPYKTESIQFSNDSYDPYGVGFETCDWDFGDGSSANDCYPIHAFAADGDYTVQLTVTTFDGRIASASNIVAVSTHEVGITRFQVPTTARVGQTKQINVSIKNLYYQENVQVDLYKVTQNGLEWIGTLTQSVPIRPPNRPQVFSFDYTFTSQDGDIGKVNFKTFVTLIDARDAFPADNEAISLATKVTR